MNQTPDHNPAPETRGERFVRWLEDPLVSVVAASATTIGSLGIVVSGIWVVNLAIN